jgi:hypothetical protein
MHWISADVCIDIDWPAVQRKLGLDQVEWLLAQSPDQCQLTIHRKYTDNKLVAEFYNEQTLLTYHLMWN